MNNILSKNNKVTLTIENLLKLLHEEWTAGSQNCPGFSNCSPFLMEDQEKENFSAKTAEAFQESLTAATSTVETGEHKALSKALNTLMGNAQVRFYHNSGAVDGQAFYAGPDGNEIREADEKENLDAFNLLKALLVGEDAS